MVILPSIKFEFTYTTKPSRRTALKNWFEHKTVLLKNLTLSCFFYPNDGRHAVLCIVPVITIGYSTFTFKRVAFAIIVACGRCKVFSICFIYLIPLLFRSAIVHGCYRVTISKRTIKAPHKLTALSKNNCFQISTTSKCALFYPLYTRGNIYRS